MTNRENIMKKIEAMDDTTFYLLINGCQYNLGLMSEFHCTSPSFLKCKEEGKCCRKCVVDWLKEEAQDATISC